VKSIQARLTIILLIATAVLTVLAGSILYLYLRLAFTSQLDRSLAGQSLLLSAAVEVKSDGRVTFDNPPTFGEVRERHHARDFFEIWRLDRTAVYKSASLGAADLPFDPVGRGMTFDDVRLPSGRHARICSTEVQPFADEEDQQISLKSRATTNPVLAEQQQPLIVSIAHDRDDIDERLHFTAVALVITGFISLAMVGTIVPLAVRSAMKPVRQIALAADRINARTLDLRFDTAAPLPSELIPICDRLNYLIERLQHAFEREKRFTADAAHELRTPIAELRAMTEVAIKWPEGKEGIDRNLRDTLAITEQMDSIVGALLRLARSEAGQETATLAPVRIRDALANAWSLYRTEADCRSLKMKWEAEMDVIVVSDFTMLVQILTNLFSNAVFYAPQESEVSCKVQMDETDTMIIISNPAPALSEADLSQMFDPFWRKDASRASNQRSGLGLTIAAAFAKSLGHTLKLSVHHETFSVTLAIHQRASEATTVAQR
jgi:signal transduction histidine kinase